MVTIIETQGAGDTFAVDVTRTRNTQNPIPREAFAAQDIVNEHLRQKLRCRRSNTSTSLGRSAVTPTVSLKMSPMPSPCSAPSRPMP
ncbi:hypothetical protein D3875_20235 [Deinococcus cavernae]|uniref:Uncharacterized protein n=1 Tax=Deinococcus cavernae TaxID=2320857 RepID=A0A418V253_9DEIO|nr:hypothetical protein D3875_20235 [Deinococcus cavernae]